MTHRRDFLKTGGALVMGLCLRDGAFAQRGTKAGPPDPKQIDTWLAIHADNTATVYVGFAELGQGNSTALLQVAAEELDFDMSQVSTVRLDTHVTPNQGGTYSSASIARGGPQVRAAAAEARLALLNIASKQLGVPVAQLTVAKGVVSGGGKSVTYGELIGDKRFDLAFTGSAPVKSPSAYGIVGTKHPRNDMPAKVRGEYQHMQHVRVPGMLHGRLVRPRGQRTYGGGAAVESIDEASIRNIVGARVVRRGDFVGVVAEREWDAVRAARQLKVTWKPAPPLPEFAKLYETMRADKTEDRVMLERGSVAGAFTGAAHVSQMSCTGPYQAHAPFGPNCAIADASGDSLLVMSSTQDVYATRNTLARILGMPLEKVRVQYYEGSGTYGHSTYDDVAQAAAILSQLAGKPVRLQLMRWDEHGWDNYGPAHVGEVRAACDAQGRLTAYEYHGWQHNWSATETSEQLAYGKPAAEWPGFNAQQVSPQNCGAMYTIPNLSLVSHKLPALRYLKAGWLRSPLDLAFSFTSEQAIDDLAFRLGMDPFEFRLRNIKDERWQGVLEAAAKAADWSQRRAAHVSASTVVTGRGIGLGTHLASWGGAVADLEVNRDTGAVRITHLYGAIDAGQVVNPGNVESQIVGQMVQTASRMLKEEVKFEPSGVTSLDWNSYPILRFEECPEVTPIVVQRINEKPSGAGEEAMAAAAGAIANAFFDATGVRMRTFPFTPERVLAALKKG